MTPKPAHPTDVAALASKLGDEWTVTLERRGGLIRRWRADVTHGMFHVGEAGYAWRALTPARLVAKVAKCAARDQRGRIVINVRERDRWAG